MIADKQIPFPSKVSVNDGILYVSGHRGFEKVSIHPRPITHLPAAVLILQFGIADDVLEGSVLDRHGTFNRDRFEIWFSFVYDYVD